ncbi:MAG TPA: sigma 54-interacting transcriptional regulator [Kofleriaceae bacterium]|jgi:DNA-binding NtrC family response regulator
MQIALVIDRSDEAMRVRQALVHRGHHVREPQPTAIDALAAADLIVADAEYADLVAQLAIDSPGIELILLGGAKRAPHPDVIAQLERPFELPHLLAVVDELADVLDGEKLREPTDVVAYETVFAGDSPQIRELLKRVRIVARSDAPVWISGDDGSGRTVIARAIHDRSSRRGKPFVAFNAVAYSDDDLAALLAAGTEGTLFVERVGATGPQAQRALLHYIETAPADGPRLIVGTQRDIVEQFSKSELYYRLKVLEVEIPTLKDRARDLEQIVGRMLERLAIDTAVPQVANQTMELLGRYSFPGNLLELAHALTHAYVLARGDAIQPEHLPTSIRAPAHRDDQPVVSAGELEALDVVAKRFERDYLLRVLRSVAGNRGRAAEILGLTRKGLWGKLKSHGISDDDIEQDDAH